MSKILAADRLSLFPFLLVDVSNLLGKDKGAFLVADHQIDQAISIEVAADQSASDARLVVNLMRHKIDLAILAREPEIIDYRSLSGPGVVEVVSPVGLSGHNVFQAVAIDVDKLNGMQLGKLNAIPVRTCSNQLRPHP